MMTVLVSRTVSNREEEYKTPKLKRINKQSYTFKLNKMKKGFEHNGVWITDPFYDETGRFEVNPVEYYGNKCLGTLLYLNYKNYKDE